MCKSWGILDLNGMTNHQRAAPPFPFIFRACFRLSKAANFGLDGDDARFSVKHSSNNQQFMRAWDVFLEHGNASARHLTKRLS